MPENDDLSFVFSNGATLANPDDSRGGGTLGGDTHEISSTFTSISAAGSIQVADTARVGDGDDDHNDKYLLIIRSNAASNELFWSRIIDFTDTGGVFLLEKPLPGATAVGDVYRIFPLNGLFDDATPAECGVGDLEYRAVYAFVNASGGISDGFFYMPQEDPGPFLWDIKADRTSNSLPATPDNKTDLAPNAVYNGDRWSLPDTNSAFIEQPSLYQNFAIGASTGLGVFIRRTTPANTVKRNRTVVLLAFEGTSSSPAQQVRCGMLIALNADGLTPVVTVGPDRNVRVKGGAEFNALVTAQETGLRVPDQVLSWTLDPPTGRGSLGFPESPQTDTNGRARAVYSSPTDDAEIGNVVTIEVKV